MTSLALRLTLLLLPALSLAQEKAAHHTLRILPLGDPPPFLQEVRNGVRYEIPAKEGTIPPRQLEVISATEDSKALPLRLRLGIVAGPLEVVLPESREVETRQAAGPWAKIPVSNAAATLALVWRGGADWSKAGVLAIPDGPAERNHDCRFINVTAKPMGVVWGSERLKLEPRTVLTRSLPAGAREIAVSVLYPSANGSLQSCLSTKVTPKAGRLQQFVIYAADEKQPRIPVKVLPLEEAR